MLLLAPVGRAKRPRKGRGMRSWAAHGKVEACGVGRRTERSRRAELGGARKGRGMRSWAAHGK
eukprot:362721-Chlamydomonas_euryale.AAC.1